MKILCIRTYIETLVPVMQEPFHNNEGLVDKLFTMIIDEANLLDNKKKPLMITSKIVSELMTSKTNVHRKIQNAAKTEAIIKCTFDYFKTVIAPRVSPDMIEGLIQQLLDLIVADKSDPPIPMKIKNDYSMLAQKETLAEFLAPVFLYSIKRKNDYNKKQKPEAALSNEEAVSPTDSNIMYDFDTYFDVYKDQKNILEIIRERLNGCETTPPMLTLFGMGGVGKTRTAKEYARNNSGYRTTRWIPADMRTSLLENAADFLRENKIDCYNDTESVIQAKFRSWFESKQNKNWLLIFDNVEDFNWVRPYLPDSKNGHIIFTTQFENDYFGAGIEIGCFNKDTAKDFLINRSGKDDALNAYILAKELGYLPLALEQAAAFIAKMQKKDFVEYLSFLREYGTRDTLEVDRKSNYHRLVHATLEISLDRIKIPNARELLNVCAFLASDEYYVTYLANFAEEYKPSLAKDLTNKLKRTKLISELLKYSLIKYKDEKISVHRLLQEVIRDNTGFDENWYDICCRIFFNPAHRYSYRKLHDIFPLDTGFKPKHSEQILAVGRHLRYMANNAPDDESRNLFADRAAHFHYQLGLMNDDCYPRTKQHLDYALEAFKIALEMCRLSKSDGATYACYEAYKAVTIVLTKQEKLRQAIEVWEEYLSDFGSLTDPKTLDYIKHDIKLLQKEIEEWGTGKLTEGQD